MTQRRASRNGDDRRGILSLPDDRYRRAILAAVRAVGSLHESHVAVRELGRGRFVATVSVSAVSHGHIGDRVVTWRDNGEGLAGGGRVSRAQVMQWVAERLEAWEASLPLLTSNPHPHAS